MTKGGMLSLTDGNGQIFLYVSKNNINVSVLCSFLCIACSAQFLDGLNQGT